MTATASAALARTVPGLRMGEASWDGLLLATEVAAGETGRIYRLGPVETLVLSAMDEPASTESIQERVESSCGLRLPAATVNRLVDTFIRHGLIQEETGAPCDPVEVLIPAGPAEGGRRRGRRFTGPGALPRSAGAVWRLSGTPLLTAGCVAGIALAAVTIGLSAVAWQRVTGNARTIADLPLLHLAGVVLAVVVWHMCSQLGHELSHAAAFARLGGGRTPILTVTKLGPIPVPSTRLEGMRLVIGRWRRFLVALAGPLFTLAFALIPAVASTRTTGATAVWGSLSLIVDLTIVILSLSPFPNTDMTRGLEALTSTRQLPLASSRSRQGYPLPRALPSVTRLAVRGYPILLLTAIVATAGWALILVNSLR